MQKGFIRMISTPKNGDLPRKRKRCSANHPTKYKVDAEGIKLKQRQPLRETDTNANKQMQRATEHTKRAHKQGYKW